MNKKPKLKETSKGITTTMHGTTSNQSDYVTLSDDYYGPQIYLLV